MIREAILSAGSGALLAGITWLAVLVVRALWRAGRPR